MARGTYAGRRVRRDATAARTSQWCLAGGFAAVLLATRAPEARHVAAVAGVQLLFLVIGAVGLARQRMPAPPPWPLLLLARGLGVLGVGLGLVRIPGDPGAPAAVGALLLLPYPVLAIAALVRRRQPWSWSRVTDVATVATGSVLLLWALLVRPLAGAEAVGYVQLILLAGFVAVDLAGLVWCVRRLLTEARRSTATVALAGTAVLIVLGDLLCARVGPAVAGWPVSWLATGFWLASSVTLAATVLHPSIGRQPHDLDDDPREERDPPALGGYLALALLAVATPVVGSALAAQAGRPETWRDAALSGVLTGVFAALLIIRFARAARTQHRRAAELMRQMVALDGLARSSSRKVTALDLMVQQHREHQRDLEYRATHDPVTMLANRALFDERLNRAMNLAGHHAGVALLMLDLDGFKAVNDTLGHLVGDELLRVVAQRLLAVVPTNQTVARLGGDEFAILITGVRESSEAMELAHRLLLEVSSPYEFSAHRVSVTVSIGIRHLPRFRSEPPADIMRHADTAMYTAKRAGKNRASLYELAEPARFAGAVARSRPAPAAP